MSYVPPTPLELKKEVLSIVQSNPERHYQSAWVGGAFGFTEGLVEKIRSFIWTAVPDKKMSEDGLCGTKACVAGWAGILASPKGTLVVRENVWGEVALKYPDGTEEWIEDAAARLLDLDEDQKDWLFDGARSRQEVIAGLEAVIADPRAVLGDDEEDDYDDYDDEDDEDEPLITWTPAGTE